MKTKWITRSLMTALASLFAAGTSVAQTFEVVHSFVPGEGMDPQSGLVQMLDGDFAGTTVGGFGTLFKMDTRGRLVTVHLFEGMNDGANPHAPLLLTPDGGLFGTTMSGLAGWGGVFELKPSGNLIVLKAFVLSTKGPEGEGAFPHAPLYRPNTRSASDGMYYGVTTRGGMDDLGTIFSMDAFHNVKTIRHFSGIDGAMPFESLVELDGYLFGTTTRGGAANHGTIFRLDLGGANFQVIHDFAGFDGARPEAPLIVANGVLYGTTFEGGRTGLGTVFQLDPSGANFHVLHSFAGIDGANPHAALVKARDGHLYGTTFAGEGGLHDGNFGNIFKIHGTRGDLSIVHRFTRWDGAFSQSRLIEASDGALYGTTGQGGSDDLGVVFRVVFVPIRSIAPSSGPAAGGTAVAITGGNFRPGAGLTFGGADAERLVVASESSITAVTPALEAGTLNDVLVDNLDRTRGGVLKGFFADFLDVARDDIFHDFVEKAVRNRVTAGLGNGTYGRDASATRAQIAVFLLKAKHGPFYAPPPATGTVFADVPADDPFASWIEQLYHEGITYGCDGGTRYCPYEPTTREQMAVLIVNARSSPNLIPPECRGIFLDVPCSSPFAPSIEILFDEGITGGCGGRYYCPADPATRGQAAAFVTKAFHLP